jgi:hypothetical protein
VIKGRRVAARGNENCDPVVEDEGIAVVYLDAVTVDQGHRVRPERRSSLEGP